MAKKGSGASTGMTKVTSPIMDFMNAIKGDDGLTLDDARLYPEYIDTGIYVLNGILSGDMFWGLETGRTTELAGESASGKSAIATFLMESFLKRYEKENGMVILYETEGRVSKSLIKMISPQYQNRVLVIPVVTVEQLKDKFNAELKLKLAEFSKNGQELRLMLVLDSLGNLSTNNEIENAEKGDTKSDTGRRAKLLKEFFRTISIPILSKYQIPFLAINHVYDVIGAYVPTTKAGGGKGPEFLANNIIEVKTIKTDDTKDQDKATAIRLRVMKSMSLQKKTEVILNFINGKFSKYSSILDIGTETGIIKSRNAGSKGKVYIFENNEYSKSDLKAKPDVMENIVKKVNEAWKAKNSFLVDASVEDDIDADEVKDENGETVSEELE